MPIIAILGFLATWGLIGAALFSLFVIMVFRTGPGLRGPYHRGGSSSGACRSGGYLAMGSFLIEVLGFFLLANRLGLSRWRDALTFTDLLLLNLALYLMLFGFDSLVIDYLVLSVWRPRFLRLPAEMGAESMATHIRYSIPVGIAVRRGARPDRGGPGAAVGPVVTRRCHE